MRMKRILTILLMPTIWLLGGCKSWIDKIVPAWCLAMACGGCLCVVAMASCTVSTHDDAEWSIFWGTKVGISSTSKKTTGDTSWAKTEVPAFEEWFLKDDAVVGPPAEVSVVPVTPVPVPEKKEP